MAEGDVTHAMTGLVPDPNNVPVIYANLFGGGGTVCDVINFTLCVNRFTPTYQGKSDPDAIIAARLRIDLDTAIVLRNFLNSQIELASAPKGQAN